MISDEDRCLGDGGRRLRGFYRRRQETVEAANEARGQEKGQEKDVEQEVANAFARQIDLVQQRYGWTDDEIKGIPSLRFFEIVETIVEARRDEERQRLQEIAYGQWCAYRLIPVKGKHKGFKAYCDVMGLGDKAVKYQWPERTAEEVSVASDKILAAYHKENDERSGGNLQDSREDPDQREDGDS